MDEIGDVVTALPVFYNLNRLYPKASQTLVCKSFNNIFFRNLDYVQCVNDFKEVSTKKYDLVIDLRGTDTTRKYALKHRPKARFDRGSIRFKNKFTGGQKNEIDTNLEVITPIAKGELDPRNAIVLSTKERQKVQEFIELNNPKPFVVIHLGARDKARRWPIERFANVVGYINSTYSMPCVLVGGPDDNQLNQDCLAFVKSKHNFNVVGEFNLNEYAALCEQASLFIGNESGPLHIAAAMNIPTIALFGPGVRDVFYPKSDNSIIHHYFLANGHKKQTIENSTIFTITVDEVKESVDKILS